MAEFCPEPIEGCKYRDTDQCILTTHHIFWPAFEYATRTEKQFRQLETNKMELPRCEHDQEHLMPAPPKPPRSFMLSEIQRHG